MLPYESVNCSNRCEHVAAFFSQEQRKSRFRNASHESATCMTCKPQNWAVFTKSVTLELFVIANFSQSRRWTLYQRRRPANGKECLRTKSFVNSAPDTFKLGVSNSAGILCVAEQWFVDSIPILSLSCFFFFLFIYDTIRLFRSTISWQESDNSLSASRPLNPCTPV